MEPGVLACEFVRPYQRGFFRGEVPHRPEKHIETPIRFLATIHYDTQAIDLDNE